MEPFSVLLAICAGNSPAPVNSPHKGQWCGAFMFSLICAWINDWVNNHEAGDLRRHRGHYDVNVMLRECQSKMDFNNTLWDIGFDKLKQQSFDQLSEGWLTVADTLIENTLTKYGELFVNHVTDSIFKCHTFCPAFDEIICFYHRRYIGKANSASICPKIIYFFDKLGI